MRVETEKMYLYPLSMEMHYLRLKRKLVYMLVTMDELYHFFCEKGGRVLKYKEYFEKNQVIAEAYRFISGVIQYIKKQNNNPKHKRYLKI